MEYLPNLKEWVELAKEFGPFLFALLFLFCIPKIAHKWYQQVVTRENPRASEKERNVYRLYFLISIVGGLVLVTASVGWWFYAQSQKHVFEGAIVKLKSSDVIDSREFFFRTERRTLPFAGAPELRDEHFVLIRDEAFRDGDTFTLDLWRGVGGDNTPKEVKVEYIGGEKNTFKLDYDEESDTYKLVRTASNVGRGDISLVPPAYAQGMRPEIHPVAERRTIQQRNLYIQRKISPRGLTKVPDREGVCKHPTLNVNVLCSPPKQRSTTASPNRLYLERFVRILQDEKADIGSKLQALDRLRRLTKKKLRKVVRGPNQEEPFLLTLFDLSRSSDKELGYKARSLLRRIGAVKMIVGDLKSTNRLRQKSAERILVRLTPQEQKRVLSKPGGHANLVRLIRQLKAGKLKSNALRPTVSAQGDRYYVRAKWDRGNIPTRECLTKLFNNKLISNRTLKQETRLMAKRKQRTVYWYSKEWAISMARDIRKCGAKAKFIGF